jgi:hypothetical protein
MSKPASQLSVEPGRVTRVVRQHRHSAVRSLPSALCANVDAWAAGADQYDDMTVVGRRVRG